VRSSDGAGLGLYLVRRILERHGGDVWCESSQEIGTRFVMKLPANGPPATSPA
jgi:signal transduction histidine kinase